MHVLSLSCVFPRPGLPNFGIFVRRRLEGLARRVDLRVIAPVGVLDYAHPEGTPLGNWGLPRGWSDGPLEVWYPRWLYPPGGGFLNPILLSSQLRRPLEALRRSFPFDLIDAHFGYPDGIAAGKLAQSLGVPYMVTLRGNETMHCENPRVRSQLASALRGAARVVTVSEALREFAISLGVAAEKVRTIPNGIDRTVFYPRDRRASRHKYGLGPDERIVLSAGYLIERKGHHHVVEAVADLHRRGLPSRLLIAGAEGREGSFGQQIRDAVERNGIASHVLFMGELTPDALAEVMSAADVLCLASSREGWPNVVHETMGCGTPVVATNIGGVPDMLACGDRGTIVPGNQPKVLSNALFEALQRDWDRESISRWAHSRDWENVADEVLSEIQHAVCKRVQ